MAGSNMLENVGNQSNKQDKIFSLSGGLCPKYLQQFFNTLLQSRYPTVNESFSWVLTGVDNIVSRAFMLMTNPSQGSTESLELFENTASATMHPIQVEAFRD